MAKATSRSAIPRSPLRKQTGDELEPPRARPQRGTGRATGEPVAGEPAGGEPAGGEQATGEEARGAARGSKYPTVAFRAAAGERIRRDMRRLAAIQGEPIGDLYERALLEFIAREGDGASESNSG